MLFSLRIELSREKKKSDTLFIRLDTLFIDSYLEKETLMNKNIVNNTIVISSLVFHSLQRGYYGIIVTSMFDLML